MVLRITGMSSGMDIDKIVSDLMKAERIPLDKIKQKKTLAGWSMDQYREINSKLASFRSTTNNLRLSGDWNQLKTTSSNTSVITATSAGGGNTVNHTIEVVSMAKGVTTSSSAAISKTGLTADSVPLSTTITDTNDKFNVTLDGVTKTISIPQGTYTYNDNSATDILKQLQSQIDNAFGVNKVTVSNASGKIDFKSTGFYQQPQLKLEAVSPDALTNLGFSSSNTKPSYKVDRDAALSNVVSKLTSGSGVTLAASNSITINGVQIDYTSSDTLTSLMNKVNSSAAGVSMSYDEMSDRIMISTKQTGSAAKITLSGDSSGLFNALKVSSAAGSASNDLQVKIDGVVSYRSSNSFLLDGINYTANGVGTSTVSVTKDTDAVFNKIKDFITQYNDTLDLLNKRINEERFKDYAPLTDEQKADMKESDIKLWEDKAKSGLLHNDSLLKKAVSSLRSISGSTIGSVSSLSNALYKIGIDTKAFDGGYDAQESGKLYIDEDKLRKAIAEDPDGVIGLFSNQSTDPTQKGIAQRMYEQVNSSISELIDKAGSVGSSTVNRNTVLGSQIYDFTIQITNFEAKLTKKETFYYQRFSAMEKAIQNNNSQLSFLSQNMG